ncbi:MAG: epoxide hydrolase, partial [Streptosporangiaceae bacterium]|nr:epoxide hydrolase [Streptosporangiaceae bacterium]
MTDATIRPYRVDIPQAALDDLAGRLSRTLWPDELPGATGDYGMTTARVRDLAAYWRDGFDWRAVENRLNSHPQFVTDIGGETIHFLHVRSSREDATPLLLTHGWPGSVLEYLDVITPLAEPGDP